MHSLEISFFDIALFIGIQVAAVLAVALGVFAWCSGSTASWRKKSLWVLVTTLVLVVGNGLLWYGAVAIGLGDSLFGDAQWMPLVIAAPLSAVAIAVASVRWLAVSRRRSILFGLSIGGAYGVATITIFFMYVFR